MQRAARLVEQLGLPLELDTDGIWCALPASFPENFEVCILSSQPAVPSFGGSARKWCCECLWLKFMHHRSPHCERQAASTDQDPFNAQLRRSGGKPLRISYPCVILNVMVAGNNTNDQYQDLISAETLKYSTSSQMSIEFEVDGPYKAWPLLLLLPEACRSR